MTEEPENTSEEQEPVEEPTAEAPEEAPAVEETPAEEPVAEEAPAEEPIAEEAPAEEPAGEEAPADEPAAEEAPAGDDETAAPAAAPEAEAPLHPKELRRRERSRAIGPAGPPRSAEERQAQRQAERRAKATVRRSTRARQRAKAAERRAQAPAQEIETAAAKAGGRRKVRQGIVVSAKPDKTITVRIDVARRHRRYEKILRSSATLHAHDETNDAREGDTVKIIESRPLSRTKRWRLVEVVERAR